MKSAAKKALVAIAIGAHGAWALALAAPAPPGCMVAERTFENTQPTPIPDGSDTVASDITVAGLNGTLFDVSVQLSITHADTRDLRITLSHGERRLTLAARNGASGAFGDVTFVDDADPGSPVPYGGSANPRIVTDHVYTAGQTNLTLTPVEPLSSVAFVPEMDTEGLGSGASGDANGTWRLSVSDGVAGNAGTLNSWRLVVRTIPPPFLAYDQAQNETQFAISAGQPGVVTSLIQLPAQDGVVRELALMTYLEHTFSADLDVTLTSPAGTVVTLTTDNGGDLDDVFNGTYWWDPAAAVAPIGGLVTEYPYVDGNFAQALAPEEPLAAFRGEDPAGIWTLTVSDDRAGDGGRLVGWSLGVVTIKECADKGDFAPPSAVPQDFGGGGSRDDLVFRRAGTNEHVLWVMNGATAATAAGVPLSPAPAPGLEAVGSDRFISPAAVSDLVFRDMATGRVEFWDMADEQRQGEAVPLTGAAPLPLNWKLSATGDFNHDGNADLLWRNTASQKLVVWTLGENGAPTTQKTGAIVPDPDQAVHANWEIAAALDFDHDNNRDLLWYNAASGKIVVWFMDAEVRRITGTFTEPSNAGNNNWQVVAGGDYGPPAEGDRIPDLVWRNATSGKLVIWYMNGATNPPTRMSGTFTSPDGPPNAVEWTVVAPK